MVTGHAAKAVVHAKVTGPGLLAVQAVVGAGQGVHARLVVVQRAAHAQGQLGVKQARGQLAHAAFDFQLQPGGLRLGEVDRLRHPARHGGVAHGLQGGDAAHQVIDLAVEHAHADHAAAAQVFLIRQVQAGGQLGQQLGVANAVGRQLGVGLGGVGEQAAERRAVPAAQPSSGAL